MVKAFWILLALQDYFSIFSIRSIGFLSELPGIALPLERICLKTPSLKRLLAFQF